MPALNERSGLFLWLTMIILVAGLSAGLLSCAPFPAVVSGRRRRAGAPLLEMRSG